MKTFSLRPLRLCGEYLPITMIPEEKPLAGKRIVVTRAKLQAEELAGRIEELGGEVVEFPTIEIQPPDDYGRLDRAIENLSTYDWVFFTSVNGVDQFLARLRHHGRDARDLDNVKIAAIGPETANRLAARSVKIHLIPGRFQAEGLLEELAAEEIRGKNILVARAARARDVLPDTLSRWGGNVDVVSLYRIVTPDSDPVALRALLQQKKIDAITFTSSSTVTHFAEFFPGENLAVLLAGVVIACIGPITAKTAEDLGLDAAIVAEEYTVRGLVSALADYFQQLG